VSGFTADWFTEHAQDWLDVVWPRFRGLGPVRWLEVGSYEGLSALWVLDNVLPRGSEVWCLDHFDGDYEARFDANVAGRGEQIVKFKAKSQEALTRWAPGFDGAYVDGSHEEADVLADAREVWRILRPGGLVVFDDVGMEPVGRAVDALLAEEPAAQVLRRGWQAFVEKRLTRDLRVIQE